MSEEVEVPLILNSSGLKCVRVVGPSEKHIEGHRLYFLFLDLIKKFEMEVQERLQEGHEQSTLNS